MGLNIGPFHAIESYTNAAARLAALPHRIASLCSWSSSSSSEHIVMDGRRSPWSRRTSASLASILQTWQNICDFLCRISSKVTSIVYYKPDVYIISGFHSPANMVCWLPWNVFRRRPIDFKWCVKQYSIKFQQYVYITRPTLAMSQKTIH